MTLDDLGPRIIVLGPSSSGKSTLANAIGQARGLPPIHLDQLHHRPGTDWRPRPAAEFIALHDAALQGERWVIEGNYASCLPRRLARATGLIVLDAPTAVSLFCYVRRCWFERDRIGGLAGARDGVKWAMIRHIAVTTRADRRRHRRLIATIALPAISLPTRRALAAFYRAERLDR